jgi:hypothetical protein
MADNVFVIPATIRIGKEFPPYLPVADGALKATAECTRTDVEQAVAECRQVAQASRARLEAAYQEHLKDIELLAQVSAYLEKYDQWDAVRRGGEAKELLWQVDLQAQDEAP